jgi:hypothetical protein
MTPSIEGSPHTIHLRTAAGVPQRRYENLMKLAAEAADTPPPGGASYFSDC